LRFGKGQISDKQRRKKDEFVENMEMLFGFELKEMWRFGSDGAKTSGNS
jgi:hypothetical protein